MSNMVANAFLHFGVSLTLTLVLSLIFPKYRWQILFLVLFVGMFKELSDLFVDEKDLIANLFGALTAYAGTTR